MMEEMRHHNQRLRSSPACCTSRPFSCNPRSAQSSRDVHQRVLSIAELQDHLEQRSTPRRDPVSQYLSAVCSRLANSDRSATWIKLQVEADDLSVRRDLHEHGPRGDRARDQCAETAFSDGTAASFVRFAVRGSGWQLSVADNGVGCDVRSAKRAGGIRRCASSIPLAKRLGARLELSNTSPHGLTVTLIRSPQGHPRPEAGQGVFEGCLQFRKLVGLGQQLGGLEARWQMVPAAARKKDERYRPR